MERVFRLFCKRTKPKQASVLVDHAQLPTEKSNSTILLTAENHKLAIKMGSCFFATVGGQKWGGHELSKINFLASISPGLH